MSDPVYVYSAIRRNKENKRIPGGPVCIQEVLYSHRTVEGVIRRLKAQAHETPGKWRIYRSVNRRDLKKSQLELAETLHRQLIYPDSVTNKNPESLWKHILMKPANKAERLFLVDIDTKNLSVVMDVGRYLKDAPVSMDVLTNWATDWAETPNGYHIVCDPFDPKILKRFPDVEVKKDALIFVEEFEIYGGELRPAPLGPEELEALNDLPEDDL